MIPARPWLLASALIASLGSGCGGDDDYALPTEYELTFPSTEVAVVTDSVHLYVVDATGRDRDACSQLFAARNAGTKFDRVLVETKLDVCGAFVQRPKVEVSFGARAFFVAASSVDEPEGDYLLGCAVALVGSDGMKPHVDLALAPGVLDPKKLVASVNCRSLTDRCAGKCAQ
jgi:hypothetical protein